MTPGEALSAACPMKGEELARRLGYTPKHISEVFHDKARITVEMALRLEYVLPYPASHWTRLQQDYDLAQARFAAACWDWFLFRLALQVQWSGCNAGAR